MGRRVSGWPAARLCLRAAILAAVAFLLALAAACGGEKEPLAEREARGYFADAEEVIRSLVPESTSLLLRLLSLDEEGPVVDFTMRTELPGQPRVHLISDTDAVAGADAAGEYRGVPLYRQKATLWAELLAEPPYLYAGVPNNDEGLRAYIDFYLDGGSSLSDERFWNGFAFARERISGGLGGRPDLLVVDFDGGWRGQIGGLRVEAKAGEKGMTVGILFAARRGVGREELTGSLLEAFRQRFAVPEGAVEEQEVPDWGYASRIWVAEVEPGQEG